MQTDIATRESAEPAGSRGLPEKHDYETKPDVTRKIGKYLIYETLGKGGYSWVKRGVDTETGATVALKFMARATDEWAVEQADQVRTEIKSLTEIRHPNVMKLYAYNLSAKYPTADGKDVIKTILLVLEYCPGGEIFDILYYADTIDKQSARTYLRQMINGLDACHQKGIAHRDIKPQNLLLDGDFQLKITDFGLSKIIESDGDFLMRTTYVGTRGYQAPELLNNRKYTNSCDIFSMGVVVFIMLCGYPPFERAHKTDRWYKPLYKGDTDAFWKGHRGCGIPEECKDLITGMLAYKPSKRITIDEIRAHPFWDNGPVLEKAELRKRILEKYEEARKARAKDDKKMADLEHSISNKQDRDIGSKFPDTPLLVETQRPKFAFFYTPIATPSTTSLLQVRTLLHKKFGTNLDYQPASHSENPFGFRMTMRQEIEDASGDKQAVDHVIQVYLRRDPVAQRNMVYFNMLKTDSKLMWIKIWRSMFSIFHEYGVAENMDHKGLFQGKRGGVARARMSVPCDTRGEMVKVQPRMKEDDEMFSAEDRKEDSSPEPAAAGAPTATTKTAESTSAMASCAGGLLCGASAANEVE